MEECKCIYIYKGDDTNWNGENLLTVRVSPASDGVDITSMTAQFILGSYTHNYSLADDGVFQIDLSATVTGDMAFGPINGTIRILDEEGRIKTAVNTIPFYVTSEVITMQNQDLTFSLPAVSINVNVGGSISYNNLSNKPTLNGVTIEGNKFSADYNLASTSDVNYLQSQIDNLQPSGDYVTQDQLEAGLSTKEDTISDLAQIRFGAALGESAVQPATLTSALAAKQDTLSAEQLEAVNSGVDSVKVAQIATNTTEISGIESKIPTQASAQNQLADKDFVNSSINSLAAFYITSDAQGNPFATRAALVAGPWYFKGELRTPTLNDYSIVTKDETHDDKTSRFMYDGTQWVWQYDLNNTTFTAEQIAAINSGITSSLVTQIGTNENAITSLQNSKQDVIGDLATIRSGASAGATAVQPSDVATASTVGLVKPDGTTATVDGNGTLSAVIPANIWTQDNLIAGNNISITQVQKPVIDENTLGVWHFDGNTDNAVSDSQYIFTEASKSYTSFDSAKFGTYALKVGTSFGSTAERKIITFPEYLGVNDITIDLWIKYEGGNAAELGLGSDYRPYGFYFAANVARVFYSSSSYINLTAAQFPLNEWNHIALERANGYARWYVNGNLIYSKTDDTNFSSVNSFYLYGGNSVIIDELRISNTGRYNGQNFTPYSEPYAAAGGSAQYQINSTTDITIDSALSSTSENPVQNKVVTSSINTLYDAVSQKQDALPSGTTGYFLQKTASGIQWAEVKPAPTVTWYTGNSGYSITIPSTSSATLVKVYKNGMLLQPSVDYTISGTILTVNDTPLFLTDKIILEVF